MHVKFALIPRRVLVVDDEPDAGRMMALLLEELGHTTRQVTSPESALDTVTTFRPQVALVDVVLPRMTGIELGAQMLQLDRSKKLKLIAVSGLADGPDLSADLMWAGFDGFLTKPVSIRKVIDALEAAWTLH